MVPSQVAQYLGMEIHSSIFEVFPNQKRVNNLIEVIELFTSQHRPPVQEWLVLLGHLSSISHIVPGGRRRMCNLQFQLPVLWDRSTIAGSVIRDSDSRPPSLHGCVFGRMGSIQPGQGSEQRVVPPGETGAHQLFRVESSLLRPLILRGITKRKNGSDSVRQHHCTFIPQQGRWHKIEFAQQGSSDNLTVDGGECSNRSHAVCKR